VEVLYAYRAEGHYRLHEFVAMPEHIHLIFSPAMNVTLEQAMQFIKGGFSYRVKRETEWKLEVWQRGFTDHRIRDVEDFMKHRQYVRQNPVKRGLVMAAEE
jgi:putative transposase